MRNGLPESPVVRTNSAKTLATDKCRIYGESGYVQLVRDVTCRRPSGVLWWAYSSRATCTCGQSASTVEWAVPKEWTAMARGQMVHMRRRRFLQSSLALAGLG